MSSNLTASARLENSPLPRAVFVAEHNPLTRQSILLSTHHHRLNRMLTPPGFESAAIIGNRPTLVAELSSLFAKPGRYLPVLDGPRMTRSDASNEIIRRVTALAFTHLCRPPTMCVGIESAVRHAGYVVELTIILVVVRLASAQTPLRSR